MDNSISEIIVELNTAYGSEEYIEILKTLIVPILSTVVGAFAQRYAHIGSAINIYKKEKIGMFPI